MSLAGCWLQVPQIFLPTRPGFFRDPDENTKYYLRETYGRLLVVGSLSLRIFEQDHIIMAMAVFSWLCILFWKETNMFFVHVYIKNYIYIFTHWFIFAQHLFHVYIHIYTYTTIFFIYDTKPVSKGHSSFQPCSKLSHWSDCLDLLGLLDCHRSTRGIGGWPVQEWTSQPPPKENINSRQ